MARADRKCDTPVSMPGVGYVAGQLGCNLAGQVLSATRIVEAKYMSETSMTEFARKLAQARQNRVHLQPEDGAGCANAADAYRVQAEVAGLTGARVAGWKVGIHTDGVALAAPIFESDLAGDSKPFMLGGDMSAVKVEVELALLLDEDLPLRPGNPYSREDIFAATAEMFCGIELVANRFVAGADIPFSMRLADNFSHGAYSVGSGNTDFSGTDPAALRCIARRDGAVVADLSGGHPLGDPLLPVLAWANAQCDELGGLCAGQFITTGTLIEPFTLDNAAEIEGQLEGIGEAEMIIQTV